MTGQASGGQALTPNLDINAPAGTQGDLWGKYGGGIVPVGNKPVAVTVSDGETAANYAVTPAASVISQESTGALNKLTLDSSLPAGAGNFG